MKNKKMVLTVCFLIGILSLSGCQKNGKDNKADPTVYKATVMQNEGESLLIAKNDKEATRGDVATVGTTDVEIVDKNGEAITKEELKGGMQVSINFDGTVMETYPLRLSHPTKIKVVEQKNDVAQLYRKVIDQLYMDKIELNNGIDVISLDLTKVNNLTESEKAALVYMVQGRYSYRVELATHDELVKTGKIDEESDYYTRGILITIEDRKMNQNEMIFTAAKWRSIIGEVAYGEQKAVFENGVGSW